MPDTFQLEIVTPEKKVVDVAATEAQIPGKNGYLGILPGHAPLITELAVGEITFKAGADEQRLAVAWGFAEVLPDRVTILAETAERPSEIDARRKSSPAAILTSMWSGLWQRRRRPRRESKWLKARVPLSRARILPVAKRSALSLSFD
jgi:F-type H+-transporting ATPase subunit epsilon